MAKRYTVRSKIYPDELPVFLHQVQGKSLHVEGAICTCCKVPHMVDGETWPIDHGTLTPLTSTAQQMLDTVKWMRK